MTPQRLVFAGFVVPLLGFFQWSAAEPPPSENKSTFWVIPHTHWEGAVFKTREEYLEMGLPNILKAMKLLRQQPDYRFVLDQVAYVKPFLERYPDQERDFRKFLAEGRLQLVGGLDVMPDVNMPGGETFIRQMQYGKRYYREQLGIDVTTCWLIDTFGHHPQLPQLLVLAGYKSFWFSRGVPRPDHPSEFLWEGIDGTRIPAFWLPYSYGLLYGSPRDLTGFQAFARQRFELLTPNSQGKDRVGLSGVDVSEPEEHLASLIAAFNKQGNAPFVMRMGLPSDFEAAAARRTDRPVFRGEFNPIFQGTYSSRIELKAWMRIMERKLLTAEALAALACWFGAPFDETSFWRAWEPVLFNETHDLASGVMTDHVYDDTVRSYEFANRLADGLIDSACDALISKIDTRGSGIPVIVFNSLGWARSDIAHVDLGFAQPGLRAIGLRDEQCKDVPYQIEAATYYADGDLKTARIAFVASSVPALGYRVFHVAKREPAGMSTQSAVSTGDTVETRFCRVTFDLVSGAIKSLRVKPEDFELFSGPANIVARQQDRGDLWELYHGLDGGSKIAITNRQKVPRTGQARFSDEFKGQPGSLRTGPVYSELHVAHPFDTGRYETFVRVYADLERIDCELRLVNNEKFVRYQALFPTTIKDGKSTHEIPFGAIERPLGIEFPAQNWVDYGDSKKGLAVLNSGLPGNLVIDATMMLSLLRAHSLGAYGFGGGYEPGMSSDSGFQLGRERTLHYALLPHTSGWPETAILQESHAFLHPLISRVAAAHDGPFPPQWGFLTLYAWNVVVSSLKPAHGGGVALRVYEWNGKPASRRLLKLHTRVATASEANLMEDPGRMVPLDEDSLRFDARPFEIKTFILRPPPGKTQ